MRHPIDPKIDCVFKALLGAEANRRLLIHFLNAVLGADLPAPVAGNRLAPPLRHTGIVRAVRPRLRARAWEVPADLCAVGG